MTALWLRQRCGLCRSHLKIKRLWWSLDEAFLPASLPPLWDRDGTPAKMQHRGSREAGGKMSKNSTSRSTSARKSLSHPRPEKKKVRRAIFKADQWYENAAMSIGIAGRPKGARPGAALIPRVKDRAD
jgi:hypothetical protein